MSEPEELTDDQRAELLTDLQTLLSELDAFLSAPSDTTDTVDLEQPIGRISRVDALQQQKMAREARRRHELRRSQVRRALSTIEDDEYGDCRRCDEPIDFRRLKARPESPFCVDCVSSMEKRR